MSGKKNDQQFEGSFFKDFYYSQVSQCTSLYVLLQHFYYRIINPFQLQGDYADAKSEESREDRKADNKVQQVKAIKARAIRCITPSESSNSNSNPK